MILFEKNKEGAMALDKEDPLSCFRQRFYLLPGKIYMDGNSLWAFCLRMRKRFCCGFLTSGKGWVLMVG